MSTTILTRDTTHRPSTRRGRVRRAAIAAAALAVAAGGAWYGHDWWTTARFIQTTDDAYVGGNVTSIAPHVAGFIQQVAVGDNEHVRAGQLLVRLDPRDYQASLDHAVAVLASRLAMLDGLQAQHVLQQSIIRQQQAALAAKAAAATFAIQDDDRYRSLALTAAGSRQDAQKAAARDLEARSDVAAAEAGLDAARQQIKVLDAQITEATASVAQSRADVETSRLALGYTEIRSPIDGYVANRAAQVGAYVAAGAYLISVTPAAGLWVDANFKEDQLARMTAGEAATITADVLPDHVFHGHVASLSHGTGAVFSIIPPENATGNFTKIVQRVPVRVLLDGGDRDLAVLRAGLSATVSVDTKSSRSAAP